MLELLSDIVDQIFKGFFRGLGFMLFMIVLYFILKQTGLLDKVLFYKMFFS